MHTEGHSGPIAASASAGRARCELVHTNDDNRICAFRRRGFGEDLVVIGSLNNRAFRNGYNFQDSRIADGRWREIFNSDAAAYGGSDLRNDGSIASTGGVLTVNVPTNSLLVVERE